MYLNAQSIPAVYIPPATPGDSHIISARSPGFLKKVLAGALGFRSGQIFPEIDKKFTVLFLVNVFKRLLRTAGKVLVFFHNKCISLLQDFFLKLINEVKILVLKQMLPTCFVLRCCQIYV